MLPHNRFTNSTVVSSLCLQRSFLGNERGAVRLSTARSSTSRGSEWSGVSTASPIPGAMWRHRGISRIRGDIPILLRNPTMGWHVTLHTHIHTHKWTNSTQILVNFQSAVNSTLSGIYGKWDEPSTWICWLHEETVTETNTKSKQHIFPVVLASESF
jgi:hypothetical protein